MGHFDVLVKSMNGDNYKIKVTATTTVNELKQLVDTASGSKYTTANTRLIYAGKDIT